MCRKLFLITVGLCLFSRLCGQNIQYQFAHLDINNGLSHNQVTAVFKDSRGFMWFGTMTGLNRYDGFKFKIFKHNLKDSSSISDDFIENIQEGPDKKLWVRTRNGYNIYNPETEAFDHNIEAYLRNIGITSVGLSSIKKDKKGDFWFVNADVGIFRYSPATKKTTYFASRKGDQQTLYANTVSNIAEDSRGDFWVIYTNGVIDKIDSRTNKVVYRCNLLKDQHFSGTVNYMLSVDRQDDLWIYHNASDIGVYFFNSKSKQLKHFSRQSSSSRLNSNIVNNIIQDDAGMIWIATDHGGVNLLDKNTFSIKYLLNSDDDRKSVAQNSIVSMYQDNYGIIWIGTYKRGISYYHKNIIKFPLVRHRSSDKNSLPFEDVNRFVEDAKGNLWIGTNGGGLIYFDRKANKFLQYKHSSSNPNSLSNNVIVSLCIDHEEKLWIGTFFGGLDCFDGKKFTHYRHNAKDATTISDDSVWEIFEDSARTLWIGTLSGGLNRFDRKKGTFHRYQIGNDPNQSLYTSAISEDKFGNLWFGTSTGINVLNRKGNKVSSYVHNDTEPFSVIHNNINNMLIDSRGWVWVATREGLSMLVPGTNKFRNFRREDGLPDNIIVDIQEDENHNLWLSTSNGLSNVVILKEKNGELLFNFKNYDDTDGLQGLEFNESASLKTKRGELIFGGPNGFNIFRPADIKSNHVKTTLVLTDLQVFNKSIKPGEKINDHVILTRSIAESNNITLHYNENVFSLEFAALNFFNTDKVKLQYMLDGFDDDWLTADSKVRKATYTNLDPGSYTFKVRATNQAGVYGENELKFDIKILPPFWRTPLAYIVYVFIFAGALFYIRHRGITKIRTQFALQQERQEAKRMHELDMMKIKFFTNVSHEFRTPLSLILAPVDKMLKQTDEPEQRRQLQMVNRNARRLLNLVNQLLDFRKMEVQELKLHPKHGDLIRFIKEISFSFTDVAEKKNIGFVFDTECDSLLTQFDHDKIERILFNLLSNSFKFTPEGGHVSVLLNVCHTPENDTQVLEIKIMDTGIGIPAEKRDKIFERFFQNDLPGSMVNQGSGIGLSITKEFVKLHGGTISVESEPGEGSCFVLNLPVKEYGTIPSDKSENNNSEKSAADTQSLIVQGKVLPKKQTVLLVEDNDDFRFYLKENLRESFHIIEAANGKEGWQKALALHPNLVVSDISMPEMDGIALCRKIKSDPRTSSIPVVLLTALTGEEQQLKGIETGATDYMTKPFNFEILQSKIKNILVNQESMRKAFQKQVEVSVSDVVMESPDELFIQKALKEIEKNIGNPDFSVEELSTQMNMSRVTLYKKVLAITGKTPVEFIRCVRIKRAAQLLEKGHFTISQICYKVGFKSQKYFVRSFKAEFNMLPSAYIGQIKQQQSV